MNSPSVNNRPHRRQTPTAANTATSPASEPISSSKGAALSNADEKQEGEDVLASLPAHFGRLNLFRNHHADEDDDCAPTDEDVTETEHEDLSPRSIRPSVSTAVSPAIATVSRNKHGLPTQQQGEEDEEQPLLPLQELIERLSQVTRDDDVAAAADGFHHPRRKRLSLDCGNGRGINRNMSAEEMTRILAHINLCESSQMPPRWDLIYELALKNNVQTEEDLLRQQQQLESSNKAIRDELLERNNNAHHPSRSATAAVYDKDQRPVYLSEDEEWKEIDEDDDDDDESEHDDEDSQPSFYSDVDKEGQPIATNDVPPPALSDDELSLSLNELWDVPEEVDDTEHQTLSSGIWLDATSHSCDSSVTWYEDKDLIEEIVISEDEDDEELREILLADALSSLASDSKCASSRKHDGDDISDASYSYVEEIVDSVTFKS